jgi:outer membrane protein
MTPGTAVLALLAFFGGQVPVPVAPGVEALTLEQAVAIAEQNAFGVRIAGTQVERQRAQVDEARAGLNPRVNVGATYLRRTEEQVAQVAPGAPPIVVQPIDATTVTANLTLPIDISGAIRRQIDAGRANLRAAEQNEAAARSDVRLAVRRAYMNVLRAERFVLVQAQALANAQERLKQTQALFDADQVARVEVTRLETLVAQAQSDLIAAENALLLARQGFNLILARPIETPVALQDVTVLPTPRADPEAVVAQAQVQRPEARALAETLEALANVRRATEAALRPSLSAGITHQENIDAQGFTAQARSTFGTLNLNYPLFDGGSTRARVRQIRQDEETVRIQLEQIGLGISQEVRGAFVNLTGAQARLATAERQVALAEEVLRLARIRRDAGEATYLEVIDAETELTRARTGLVAARYDYLIAFAELQRAAGTDDVTP